MTTVNMGNVTTYRYITDGMISSINRPDSKTNSYIIDYCPDLKRVTSVTDRTYNTLYEKFYWDDYEEKTVGDDLLQYYYVYGGDGLAALHVVKTGSNNQTATFTYKVITDHLGSIVSLRGNYDWGFMADYDAWGNREVLYPCSFDQYFDRGYTGHEHLLEEMGLINMNGRMYDPNLGRFLSPDNYIQSPGNPQNYNRYSYCLNNPLKYTDPSGEKWSYKQWLLASVGLGFIPIESVAAVVSTAIGTASNAAVFGFVNGLWNSDFKSGINEAAHRASNSWRLSMARFQPDDLDDDGLAQFGGVILRNLTCEPGITNGYLYSSFVNLVSSMDVEYYHGATIIRTDFLPKTKLPDGTYDYSAVTIGNFIQIHSDLKDEKYMNTLIHEYGHYMQHRQWSGISATRGGLFSLLSAANDGSIFGVDHNKLWIEQDASRRGRAHLSSVLSEEELQSYDKSEFIKNGSSYQDWKMFRNMFIPFFITVWFDVFSLY